jgi:hypothetical protein
MRFNVVNVEQIARDIIQSTARVYLKQGYHLFNEDVNAISLLECGQLMSKKCNIVFLMRHNNAAFETESGTVKQKKRKENERHYM